jgi:hypothetical protein
MNAFWKRVAFAFRCFFALLFRGEIPVDIVQSVMKPDVPQGVATAAPSASRLKDVERATLETLDRAVQMLALLQRDGRLIDFLSEDISVYADAQLGAAVRVIHETCRQILDHYVKLEPVINSEENQPVTVQAGFDSASIKLIGDVRGEPPIRGVLRHKGWRVKEINLPPLVTCAGRMVIAPAEVELS